MTDRYDKTIETISLVLGLMNLSENLTQNDKQELLDNFNSEMEKLLNTINQHLLIQDKKIDEILNKLNNRGD